MSTARPGRRYELDHLRVVATFGVILLHTGASVLVLYRNTSPDLLSNFNVGNLADSLGRFAVNGFFMASGALLLDPVRRFALKPQFLRVALPTLTWIVIYGVANVLMSEHGLPGVGGTVQEPTQGSVGDLARNLLSGPAVYHLWFVYALLGIYLIVPLLRAITNQPEPDRRRLIVWFLVLWLVANAVVAWKVFFLADGPLIYSLPLQPLPIGYVGLFMLGFALTHYRDRLRVPSTVWVLLAVVGFTWMFVSVWHGARDGDPTYLAAYGNFNPPVLLYSVGVFAWFATRERGPGPVWPLVKRLSELSFRIYLLHVLVLHLLRYGTPLGPLMEDQPAIGLPVIYASTVVIASLAAWAIDFIRPIRRYI